LFLKSITDTSDFCVRATPASTNFTPATI